HFLYNFKLMDTFACYTLSLHDALPIFQLGELRPKVPPILNPTKRRVAFIFTTWDRFCAARTLADLYSEADQFVDRVFHALRQSGLKPERIWEASRRGHAGAELRLACQSGMVVA